MESIYRYAYRSNLEAEGLWPAIGQTEHRCVILYPDGDVKRVLTTSLLHLAAQETFDFMAREASHLLGDGERFAVESREAPDGEWYDSDDSHWLADALATERDA